MVEIDETLYNKIKKITFTDYEYENGCVPSENITSILEDLLCEINRLEDKYKDFERDVEDNYRAVEYAEQIGYNVKDFY